MNDGLFKNQGDNMGCERMNKDLFSYIDGDLSLSEEITFREHMEECASCRRAYHRIQNAWNALDDWEETVPSSDLRKKILEGIRPKKKLSDVSMLIPLAAGLLIVIAAAIFFSYTQRPIYQQLTSVNGSAHHPPAKDIPGELENEIISNLNLLTEKEFYDSFDSLEKMDYLPLVEDRNGPGEDQRSALETHST
jgi:hypothetical protein